MAFHKRAACGPKKLIVQMHVAKQLVLCPRSPGAEGFIIKRSTGTGGLITCSFVT